jgi:hypothetical protein
VLVQKLQSQSKVPRRARRQMASGSGRHVASAHLNPMEVIDVYVADRLSDAERAPHRLAEAVRG